MNTVTKAEREKIITRALEMVQADQDQVQGHLMIEFGISAERARTYEARARLQFNRPRSGAGRPGAGLIQLPLRVTPEQLDWLEEQADLRGETLNEAARHALEFARKAGELNLHPTVFREIRPGQRFHSGYDPKRTNGDPEEKPTVYIRLAETFPAWGANANSMAINLSTGLLAAFGPESPVFGLEENSK